MNQFLDMIHAWWEGDAPIGGAMMAFIMALLRMMYSGKTWWETLIEGLLCGALTLTAVSTMSFFGIPKDLTVAIGGFIGFVGVKEVKRILDKIISKKIQ